jgi:hypothetical protein
MRKKLPKTRSSVTSKIEVDEVDAYIIVGFYENNQPGEVFIKIAKEGSFMRGCFDLVAIHASMLLQEGVPAAQVVEKWKFMTFEKAGLFGELARAFQEAVSLMGGSIDHGYDGHDGPNGSRVPLPDPNPAPLVSGTAVPTSV